MKTFAIYDYLTMDVSITPDQFEIPPQKINPKKELSIRPYEEITLKSNGEVTKIVYWESKEQKVKLYEEQISYQRDVDGLRTKNLALEQTKKISWYFHPNDKNEQLLDVKNYKILITNYDKEQVVDSKGVKLPTSLQLYEWGRKCKNQVHYMITKEVAGTLIDQAVFILFDNLMEVINKWQKNPVSVAFSEAIKNKIGGFDITIPKMDEEGNIELDENNNPILLKVNVWDVVVNDKGETLQKFLYERITGETI
jgi:hypothetical protein